MSGVWPPQEAALGGGAHRRHTRAGSRCAPADATSGILRAMVRRNLSRRERPGSGTCPEAIKSRYTTAQKRKARRIENSYEERGLDTREAEARAWATVNKQSGGGERSGSGRRTPAVRKARARQDSARRAVATKQRHSPNRGRMTRRARRAST